jgi:outer membrane receptor protein involved in Fe transport
MHNKLLRYILGVTAICAFSATTLHSQEEEVIVLEEVDADSVPIEESILATSRPFISLYGTEKGIVDTPRNVTIISRAQLDAISIRDPRDFTKVTSSAYTQSNFGAPSNPSIRGQTADMLVNGMRRGLTTNGNGLPVNFNAVESVNILKGPPSVAVGASQYVGGSVDLITKKPFFSGNENTVSLTGDSEGLRVYQIDSNFVLSDQSAFRVSATLEDTEDYFYDNAKRKTEALYGAYTFSPSDKYRLELSGEFFHADYSENWGWNRVTQAMLDNNVYISGGSTNNMSDLVFGVGGTQAVPSPFNFTVADTTITTELDRNQRLLANGDDSDGELITLQGIQTFNPNPDVEIVNNTLYQYRDRDTYSSYQYSEVLRENYQFENRTELRKSFTLGNLINKINTGFSVRQTHVMAANDYYHEPANFWDISLGPGSIGVTDNFVFFDNAYNNLAGTATSVPILGEASRGLLTLGRPASVGGDYGTFQLDPVAVEAALGAGNYWIDPATNAPSAVLNSNGDTNESDVTNFGLFLQDDIEINDQLSLLVGGRVDFVDAEAFDPLFDDAVAYLQQFGAAGEADRLIQLGRDEADISEELFNYNLSAVYKPTKGSSIYATYNYAEAMPRGLGGGISVQQINNAAEFILESELHEIGYKTKLLDDKAYLSLAYFEQVRTDPVQGGAAVETNADGYEIEFSYQPNRNLFVTASYAYIDATATTGGFTAASRTFDTAGFGGGGGATNFAGVGTGETESPGIPDEVMNLLVSYKLTEELGFTLAAQLTSPFVLGYENGFNFAGDGLGLSTAEVGWQHNFDLGVFYETEKYKVRFNVLNATDEENFGAVNPVYGNASVFIELPRRYELSLEYKF